MSPDALRAFQRAHVDPWGRPLAVDGIVGPRTRWARDVIELAADRQLALRRAGRTVGLVEDPPGSNRDRAGLIAAWLRACGVGPEPAPWCAAALCEWLALPNAQRRAGALNLGRSLEATSSPVAGDIFYYPTGAPRDGHGHCGLVLGVSDGEIMTCEGNCDNAVRVARRARAGIRFARAFAPHDGGRGPGVLQAAPVRALSGQTR